MSIGRLSDEWPPLPEPGTGGMFGVAKLDTVDTDRPSALWRRHHGHLGLTRTEFDEYLTGAEAASCLSIVTPHALPTPYPLAWPRNHADFQPPQSYRYLAHDDPEPLHAFVGASSQFG